MADTKTSAEAAATALAGAELVRGVQGGGNVKITATQIGAFVRGLFTTTPATIAEGGTGAATAAAARTALGLAIGTNVQAQSANLATLDANGTPGATGLASLSAATAAAGRTAIGAIPDAPVSTDDYVRSNGAWARRFLTSPPISGNWYHPDIGLSLAGGSVGLANNIYFSMLVLYRDTTISDLACRVTSVIAGNVQFAIYASSGTGGMPAGAPLAQTNAIAITTTAGNYSGPLTASIALPAGIYWIGANADTASISFVSMASGQGEASAVFGSSSLTDISASATISNYNWTFAQTYGTWPTSPAATKSNGAVQSRSPAVFFKVA